MPSDNQQERSADPFPTEATLCAPREVATARSAADDVVLYLVAIDGPARGTWTELGCRGVTAGRAPHLDIVLNDNQVSRLHVLVSVVDGEVVVEDLGSMNGTFIDGRRIARRATLPVGSLLRVGAHTFRCERCTRADAARAREEYRDLERASSYVMSLLPPPVADGPVRTDWIFKPSARLGGDAFGYDRLDARTWMMYLMDASGHGVGAAMYSVSVLNVLRERALPHAAFNDPVDVLTNLNAMFQMDRHDDQYFTMWYGVYDTEDRTLTYASAGHHPAFLVPREKSAALPLRTPALVIGALPTARFTSAQTQVPPGSSLYLFSDGVFEILTNERQWRLEDFVPLLMQSPIAGTTECQRLYQAVRAVCRPGPLEDDFSLLVVTFP